MKTKIKQLLFSALMAQTVIVLGQETLETEKKYYVDENQKLYWQGDLPIYLYISDKPDGQDALRLKSRKTPDYADPMYLDAEGLNYIRSRHAVDRETKEVVLPKTEVLYEIYKDSRSPETSISFDGAVKFKNGEIIYYGPGLSVSAISQDYMSGVDKTFISKNGESYIPYTSSFVPSADDDYRLSFYAVDNVGNKELAQSFTFIYDTKTPLSSFKTSGDAVKNIHSERTVFAISADDLSSGIKGIYYSIDDGERKKYYKPFNLAGVSDGNHTINYYAIDNVSNQEKAQSYKFYLDTKPPLVNAEIVGDEYEGAGNVSVSTRSKVLLTAIDNKSGVQKIMYSIDGGPEQEYTEPFKLPESDGLRSLEFYATDLVNNNVAGEMKDKSSSTSFNLDLMGPDLNFEYTGPKYKARDTIFITRETKVALMAADKNSGETEVGYTVNGGDFTSFSEPASFENEGLYTVEFTSVDAVNNKNTDSFFFVVDNTGPVITEVMSMQPIGAITLDDQPAPIPVYAKGAKLYLAATDGRIDTKEITFQIDGGEILPYSRPYKFRTPGLVTYQVKSRDNLGNETVNEPVTLFIK